ncbi:unnamed protein product [Linum tenue]|uniref:Uncharacterized protein n=1 Tax=Linum tenue TaxID=586396 RepID=A0AAV0J9Q6_9ROSI|nr:unnamed protein product [Linum tenue]
MIFDIDSNGSTRRVLTAREPSLVLIRPSSPTIARRDTFLPPRHRRSYSASEASCCSGRFGELAGGTTAECAAIACCCPCGLANLLFLTIYKVPVGLCRKALRRKRRQHLMKKGLLLPRARRCQCGCDNTEVQIHPIHGDPQSFDLQMMMGMHMEDFDDAGGEEMMKLEKEMWETFYDTGFWRSPSQREENGIPSVAAAAAAEASSKHKEL